MTARPYRQMGADELDQLFAGAPHNAERLHAILCELEYRSTAKALDLKRRLKDRLKLGPVAAPDKDATTRQQALSVAQAVRMTPAEKGAPLAPEDHAEERVRPLEPGEARARPQPEPMVSELPIESMKQASAMSGPNNTSKPEMTPAQRGVTQLIDYVRVLIELADKPVWSLGSYNNSSSTKTICAIASASVMTCLTWTGRSTSRLIVCAALTPRTSGDRQGLADGRPRSVQGTYYSVIQDGGDGRGRGRTAHG